MTRLLTIGLGLALLFAACSSDDKDGAFPATTSTLPVVVPTAEEIVGRYVVDQLRVNGEAVDLAPGGGVRSVQFDVGSVRFSDGCNGHSGTWELRDGRLVTANINSTLVGCSPPLGEHANAVSAILRNRPVVALVEDGLLLRDDGNQVHLVRSPAPPTSRFTLGISNQSFLHPQVRIEVLMMGPGPNLVINELFDVGSQHTVKAFTRDLPAGTYSIHVTVDRTVQYWDEVTISDAKPWFAYLAYGPDEDDGSTKIHLLQQEKQFVFG